jgi:hypothetical protein
MAEVYTYVTQAAARQDIANRLYDPNMVFWTSAELTLYLQESLRTWNALANYWRGDFLFTTSSGTTWYDLTNAIQMPNSLRLYTLHDTDIYTLLQYHLLEPVSWNPWVGNSAQFTATNLVGAVQRRMNEVLGNSGCTTTRRTIGAAAGRTVLPDTVIDIRRMAYLPAIGSPSTVWPDDTWSLNSFETAYPNIPAGIPNMYLLSTEPQLNFDVDTSPGAAGNYELLTLEAGATLTVGTPSTLSIPDDWTHVLKWGALSSLLTYESNAKDTLRAEYAANRYRMGMVMLSKSPALLALRIGNVTTQIDSVADADHYVTSWQGLANSAPKNCYYSGLNLFALSPTPDSNGGNNYSGSATVLENAPLPVNDADFVQVGRDDLSVILDYAQHLAAFKMGGADFLSTMPQFKRFMTQAQIYNAKLKELGEFTTAIYNLGQRQESVAPRTAMPIGDLISSE